MAFQPAQQDNDNIEIEKKKYKTFKEYYADPEFKRKHLEHMRQKIECESCGIFISRSNLAKHQKTTKHQQVTTKLLVILNDKVLSQKILNNLKTT